MEIIALAVQDDFSDCLIYNALSNANGLCKLDF